MDSRRGDELEVIEVDAAGRTLDGEHSLGASAERARPRFRWRRWQVLVPAALACVVAASILPVRDHVSDRAVERLERAMVLAAVLDGVAQERFEQLLRTQPPVGDRTFLAAVASVANAEADALRALIDDLPGTLLLEPRVRSVRGEVRGYLVARADELRELASKGPSSQRTFRGRPELVERQEQAVEAVRSERRRRNRPAAVADRAGASDIPPVDRFVERLRRPTDEPTGLSIIAAAGETTLSRLDLDSGARDGARPAWRRIVTSGDHVAWMDDQFPSALSPVDSVDLAAGAVSAHIAPVGGGDVVTLVGVTGLWASIRPDAFWIAEPVTRGTQHVREVDARGTTLAGPWTLPPGFKAFGATASGLVLSGDALIVWDPAAGRTVREVADGSGQPLSLGGATLAWDRSGADGSVTVTQLDSGESRPLPAVDSVAVSVSPDGRRVAHPAPTQWQVTDLQTGRTQSLGGRPLGRAAWSADSQHAMLSAAIDAYLSHGIILPAPTLLWWRVGDRKATPLRIPEGTWPAREFVVVRSP